MFEIRHYIRLETIWAQYQTYGVYRISVWTKLPISSSLSHSLTEGAQSSAFFPTTSLPLPLSSPSPELSELAGDGVERAAPPSAERAGGRRRGAASRARGCRPRRAGCAAAGRAPGRASVSSLLRRRRPKHAGGRPRRFLSRRRWPSVRVEPAAPPPAERAGGRP